ncbi:MAG: aspartate kinase [Ruminococcaceae bacterium]|nr:aspartate kinase [Oscillospiraceae bacterium]
MLIVQKFGGTSLANRERLFAAARIITREVKRGSKVVAVASAQGHTTDQLIADAIAVNPRCSAREMDAYLATGEQLSTGLLAMAVEALGFPVVSLTGWQAGLQTDGVHGNARIQSLTGERIRRELETGRIVLVTGFQGIDPEGDITTLGRGGSDTTAVALAGFLKADLCQIYTDVDGIYDKDPRIHPDAVKFDWISYEKMRRLIAGGAQVLHDRSVELAQAFGLPVEVLSSFTGNPGTIVCAESVRP